MNYVSYAVIMKQANMFNSLFFLAYRLYQADNNTRSIVIHHLKLENRLAQVLAVEDTNQTLGRVVNTHGLVDERLERTLLDPSLDILLVCLVVLVSKTRVQDDEPAHVQTLNQHVMDVLDRVGV